MRRQSKTNSLHRQKLEAAVTLAGADEIYKMKDVPMKVFETEIWNTYGQEFCDKLHRSEVSKPSE